MEPKKGGRILFVGIGNELTLEFGAKPSEEEAVTLAIARYGIGRYKNQGFSARGCRMPSLKAYRPCVTLSDIV